MGNNNQAIEKSSEFTDSIASALRDLADDVEGGRCNDPDNNLFDADAFWVDFNENVRPFVKTVND